MRERSAQFTDFIVGGTGADIGVQLAVGNLIHSCGKFLERVGDALGQHPAHQQAEYDRQHEYHNHFKVVGGVFMILGEVADYLGG